jgi:hypothetical protein
MPAWASAVAICLDTALLASAADAPIGNATASRKTGRQHVNGFLMTRLRGNAATPQSPEHRPVRVSKKEKKQAKPATDAT